jgi:hypothetical protein
MRALDLVRLQLLRLNLHILALGQFVAASLMLAIHHAAGLLIDHLLAQAVAGLAVYLVETCLFGLAGGREQRHGTRDQGQLQISLPVGTTHRHRSASTPAQGTVLERSRAETVAA